MWIFKKRQNERTERSIELLFNIIFLYQTVTTFELKSTLLRTLEILIDFVTDSTAGVKDKAKAIHYYYQAY